MLNSEHLFCDCQCFIIDEVEITTRISPTRSPPRSFSKGSMQVVAIKPSSGKGRRSISSAINRRGPSPEVVIYKKSSSATPVSSNKSKKRGRSSADLAFVERNVKNSEESDKDSECEEPIAVMARATVQKIAAGIAERAYKKRKSKANGVDLPATVVPASTRRTTTPNKHSVADQKSPVKKHIANFKKNMDVKGKGKKVVWTDDEEDVGEESEFKLDSDNDHTESSAKVTEDEQEDAAQSSDLTDIDELSGKAKVESAKTATNEMAAARNRAKRGSKAKKIDEKLTWWQKNELALELHHPELATVWSDLKLIEIVKPIEEEQPDGLSLKLLPFQREGLYWMKQQEKGPWRGGMLADEMGMGKTIQTIALILTDHDPAIKTHTLILAPTVAIMQWRNEFNKFTSGLKVCVWHGGNRTNDVKEILKFDIILTSYAVLESSFRRQNTGYKKKGELLKEDSVLHSIKWHRVILDEAHNIKDRSCNTARGAFALKAEYKWCLSGTPLQNRYVPHRSHLTVF